MLMKRDERQFNERIWKEDYRRMRYKILRGLRNALIAFVKHPLQFLFPQVFRERFLYHLKFLCSISVRLMFEIFYISRDVFWSLYFVKKDLFIDSFKDNNVANVEEKVNKDTKGENL